MPPSDEPPCVKMEGISASWSYETEKMVLNDISMEVNKVSRWTKVPGYMEFNKVSRWTNVPGYMEVNKVSRWTKVPEYMEVNKVSRWTKVVPYLPEYMQLYYWSYIGGYNLYSLYRKICLHLLLGGWIKQVKSMSCLASFPGPAQLFVAISTEKQERAWHLFSLE